MGEYTKLRKKALEVLRTELSAKLTYHDIGHTLDVFNVCNLYIEREIIGEAEAELLRIAALLHDIGFTVTYRNHEEKGTEIASRIMTRFSYTPKEIQVVQGLIMATKIPQSPTNFLEQILCDADLDYLGRSDFPSISEKLFQELLSFSFIENREIWNKTQIKFLEKHSYHTDFAKNNRQPEKERRITELKQLVATGT
jgi:predicted metal-dependent HD superfamily phosphohydrolase